MYEDEDLSELSEEDQLANDPKETISSSQKGKAVSSGYSLQRALKPPRATTYTAQALFDQIESLDIILDPEYQRDVVWTKEKQTNLIDSILRNFYIPPIIFAVKMLEDGTESKTCIDGKQRLTSIHRFMDGKIPHRDSITGEKLWFRADPSESSSNAAKRKLLPDKYRLMFANKQVVCVEYSDLTDSDERDIFQRVQLGMALTSAEKLRVISTPRAQFIRTILNDYVSEETLGSPTIPWDKARGSDFRCTAQAVYLMDKWPASKTDTPLKNAGSLPQVEKWLNAGIDNKKSSKSARDDGDYGLVEVSNDFAKKVRQTFSLMVELAKHKKFKAPFFLYQKLSPVEMICFCVLVYVHGVLATGTSKMNLEELCQAITDMRKDVREQHKDIRMNDRVGKTMIEFIQSIGKNGSSNSKQETVSAPAPGAKAKGKRRRVSEAEAEVESEDEDYQPRKRSSAGRKSKGQVGVRSKPSTSQLDHLAKARAAKAEAAAARSARAAQRASSPPNPQRLPSPGPTDPVIKSEPGISSGSQTPMPQLQIPQSQLPNGFEHLVQQMYGIGPFAGFSPQQLQQWAQTQMSPTQQAQQAQQIQEQLAQQMTQMMMSQMPQGMSQGMPQGMPMSGTGMGGPPQQ